MLEISSRNSRMWSRMGIRAFYGLALSDIAKQNPNIIAVSADLGRSSGLDRFSKEVPEQFLNVGIAEQNMIGVSAGLTRQNYKIFASTFAPFASLRASEQVRMNMGYMQEPVNLVALGSGLAMGFLGNSHYGLEDVSVMRAIPGITIVSPSDCAEVYRALQACVDYDAPVYLRLTGAINCPVVHTEDFQFEIGKAQILSPIHDVTVIASGTSVGHSLKAIQALSLEGKDVGLVNMHTVKPLDENVLGECLRRSNVILTIEEHTVVGGLGSAVAEYAVENCYRGRVLRHGIQDKFVSTGSYEYLLRENRLDSDGIKSVINSVLE